MYRGLLIIIDFGKNENVLNFVLIRETILLTFKPHTTPPYDFVFLYLYQNAISII